MNPALFDPLCAAFFKEDLFYANGDMTKFSTQKLNESYTIYSEGINKRYEGYSVDKDDLIINKSDKVVDLEEITYWLLSKDLSHYDEIKKEFIGKTSRYLNGEK